MTAVPIIPEPRHGYAPSFVPPHVRRGRHAVARVHGLPPTRIEILNERAARFFADRLRPEHLDLVRVRLAKWSAIGAVIALYVAIALGAVIR